MGEKVGLWNQREQGNYHSSSILLAVWPQANQLMFNNIHLAWLGDNGRSVHNIPGTYKMVAIIMSLAFIIKDFMLKLLVEISFLSADQVSLMEYHNIHQAY